MILGFHDALDFFNEYCLSYNLEILSRPKCPHRHASGLPSYIQVEDGTHQVAASVSSNLSACLNAS